MGKGSGKGPQVRRRDSYCEGGDEQDHAFPRMERETVGPQRGGSQVIQCPRDS